MRVVVVGGGPGGCAFAGTLASSSDHEVVLLEAGPDFGPFDDQRWPFELLDSRRIPLTYDWGLENADGGSDRRYRLERARVLGGCSAHNGCSAVRGLRADFEGWANVAGDLWRPESLLADFAAVEARLEVRRYPPEEVTPFQRDVHAAALAAGFPASRDMNDIDEGAAAAICPVNKRGGVRWNAAFGFVDPVRGRANFPIVDHAEIEAVLLRDGRAVGVKGTRRGAAFEIGADVVVLAAGAYGSPMILMRSGIGDPALLGPAGIATVHALPGVGRNLQDHPCAILGYRAAKDLVERMVAHEASSLAYDEGVIVKAQSRPDGPVDLHVFSCGGRTADQGWYWELWVGLLTPDSRGLIRPLRDGGGLCFAIEHRHFTDPAGRDLDRILSGIGHARRIAAAGPLSLSLEAETTPGRSVTGEALSDWVRAAHLHYFHPAGSCAMGRDPAAEAVTDQFGRVHGIPGLMVADASIMPRVTAANTNIPTAMIGHRLARYFAEAIG